MSAAAKLDVRRLKKIEGWMYEIARADLEPAAPEVL
jgi:hypothetical protein